MSYRIFTDASADISAELMRDVSPIRILPMQVVLDGVEHAYGPGGDLDTKDFYALQRKGQFASTSQINMQTFCDAFAQALDAGEDVFYTGLTAGLSGTYHNACMAAEELREAYPERKIVVVDSACASIGLGLLVYELARRQKEGVSLEALADFAQQNKQRLCHCFTVDVFDHLRHGGRVSAAAAAVGTLLQIKPMLCLDEQNTLKVIGKPRGRKQSILSMIARMQSNWSPELGEVVLIGHGDDEEAAAQLREAVRAQFPQAQVHTVMIGALIGAHTGPGMLALIHWGVSR